MTTVNELTAVLTGMKDTLDKAKVEIITKIDELEQALFNTPLTPEAEAALVALRVAADALDAIVPDVPPVE